MTPGLLCSGLLVLAFLVATVRRPSGIAGASPAVESRDDPSATEGATPVAAVAEAADLLALALSSGCALVTALESVADGLTGRLQVDLRRVAAGVRWGLEDAEAWSAVGEHWTSVGRAFTLASASGVPVADLLRSVAADIRAAEVHRVDTQSARLGVQIVLPLGLTFLPAFVLTTVVPVVLALAGEVLGS